MENIRIEDHVSWIMKLVIKKITASQPSSVKEKRSIETSTSIDRYYDSVNDRFEFKDHLPVL